MGLNLTHDCWDYNYSLFNEFRQRLTGLRVYCQNSLLRKAINADSGITEERWNLSRDCGLRLQPGRLLYLTEHDRRYCGNVFFGKGLRKMRSPFFLCAV